MITDVRSHRQKRRKVPYRDTIFRPTKLSGLQLWLDASRISGLGDADAVTTWTDFSNNANDATQATSAKKPLYKVNILNGRPVVRFDGTDDDLTRAAKVGGDQEETVFAAITNQESVNALQSIVGTEAAEREVSIITLTGTDTRYVGAVAGAFGDGVSAVRAAGTFTTASAIISARRSASENQIALYQNGALMKSTTYSGNASAMTTLRIGTRSDLNPQFFQGDIAEVVIYNRALSTAERQQVERYLGNKYGIALA